MDLRTIAAALGGRVSGKWVHAPGPGHSRKDTSLAVCLSPDSPEGFRVHSFAGDDWRDCLDYVRDKLGFPAWEPNSSDRLDLSGWRAMIAPIADGEPPRVVATYNYRNGSGEPLYRVCKTDPKDFFQERRVGDGWVKGLGDIGRVLYRLPDLLKHPDATVFFCEGEKDAERLVSLGHCATTTAGGAWSGSWGSIDISTFAGRDVFVLEDNDTEGRRKARVAADTIAPVAKTVRVVRLPGLLEKGDVSDWLDQDPENANDLVEVCFDAPLWEVKLPTAPIDLWSALSPPELPSGLLPPVIEEFAREQGNLMGADPAGIAMATLAVCAAAIPDRIRLQVKVHEHGWTEAARLWVALIGNPSTKKSPILSAAARPLNKIDKEMQKKAAREHAAYDELTKEEKKGKERPKKTRLRIEDTTIEAAQDILRDSPDGLLCLQDEMTAWFGGMDKYSAGRGSAKDRGFWLSAFNGGSATVDRVGRGSILIEHLSISLLGGIQPGPMRKLMEDAVDDGLIQRLCPVMLRPAQMDRDEPSPPVVAKYQAIIERLHHGGRPSGFGGPAECPEMLIHFAPEAQAVRRKYAEKHQRMMGFEQLSPKFASHLGKMDGIYARLCLIWHCIEKCYGGMADPIAASVAERVGQFLHKFLLPHAAAFYSSVGGGASVDERLQAIADFLLAHPELTEVTFRDAARGDRTMRKLTRYQLTEAFEQMEILGWLTQVPGPRGSSPPRWEVNPVCRQLFEKRAAEETERRQRLRELIREFPGMVNG